MKILSLASKLSLQSPKLVGEFENDEIMVISPLDDNIKAEFIKCEIGAISYVLALIGLEFGFSGEFWDELDEGELSGESNIGEEELPQICQFIKNCDTCIISDEIFAVNESSIKAILSLLQAKFGFKIVNLDGDEVALSGKLTRLKEIPNYDNAVIFTHSCCDEFRAGSYFGIAAKLKNGDEITIHSSQKELKAKLLIDPNIKGTIGFLGFEGAKYGFEVLKFSR
ncbi:MULTISPECIES: hypothetical protein [Campylobacter]|uniref:hypothetical protein n=1 Tax=Campylobacter TaxID=194 RepID=UPI000A33726E|nr:hypothetical protein [Campylobacter sp. P0124]MCR8697011.1 hypothetical protein [Campylobacter sp. RM19073]